MSYQMDSVPVEAGDFSHLTRTPGAAPAMVGDVSRTGTKDQMVESVRAGLDTMLSSPAIPGVQAPSQTSKTPVSLAEAAGAPQTAKAPRIVQEGKDTGLRKHILESGDVVRHKTLRCLAEVTKVKEDGSFLAEMQGVGKIKVRVDELANYDRM